MKLTDREKLTSVNENSLLHVVQNGKSYRAEVRDVLKIEKITDATFLYFDVPQSVLNIEITGTVLPDDIVEPRTEENLIVTFRQGTVFLFKCNVVARVQGNGSSRLPKKGYDFKFYNSKNQKLRIKWGRLCAVDSINVKAFFTDPTHARDVCAGRLWKQIRTSRPFPSSFIADYDNINDVNNSKYLYQDDALFYAEGFPMRMTFNGVFEGLYTWRMKKKMDNYRMDTSNKNNIFLDLQSGFVAWNYFRAVDWEVKSPKMVGYVDLGEIPDLEVKASVDRLFSWFAGTFNNTTDIRATYTHYINLDSVIDYIISCEVLGHWDANNNNIELMTWNGLTWSFCAYDMDQTMGVGFGKREISDKFVLTSAIWIKFKTVFDVEIKDRYTFLRNSGVISIDSIYQNYKDISSIIGEDLYKEDLTKWGWRMDNGSFTSIRDIVDFAQKKIRYLDSFWKLN